MAAKLSRTLPRILLVSYQPFTSALRLSHMGGRATPVLLPRLLYRNLSTNLFPRNSRATTIPLPGNVQDINAIETARFSPQRNRDRSSEMILAQSPSPSQTEYSVSDHPNNSEGAERYDCTGTVSLNSAMQTNVPHPFSTRQKAPAHLNMPGGEWSRSDKYIAADMQKALFNNNDNSHGVKGIYTFTSAQVHGHHNRFHWWNGNHYRLMSTSSGQGGDEKKSGLDKLKLAAFEYGSTVLVFHISLSLMSLGICYLAVTSGIDLKGLSNYLPVEVPEEVGGFVIAYAIHKALAPVRVSATVLCAPLIVRYLRSKGFLKVAPPSKYYKQSK